MPTYYELLAIDRDASPAAIKKAYYNMALKYHPDHNKSDDATAMIQKINEAYEVLANPDKKKFYDEGQENSPPLSREPAYKEEYNELKKHFSDEAFTVLDTLIKTHKISIKTLLKLSKENYEYISNPSCLKALQSGFVKEVLLQCLYQNSESEYIPADNWAYILLPHCLEAIQNEVLACDDFNCSKEAAEFLTEPKQFDLLKTLYIPSEDKSYQRSLFGRLAELPMDNLKLLFSPGCEQCVRDKLFSASDLIWRPIETLKSITPNYVNALKAVSKILPGHIYQRFSYSTLLSALVPAKNPASNESLLTLSTDPLEQSNPLATNLVYHTRLSGSILGFQHDITENPSRLSRKELDILNTFFKTLDAAKLNFIKNSADPIHAAIVYTQTVCDVVEQCKSQLNWNPNFSKLMERTLNNESPKVELNKIRDLSNNFKAELQQASNSNKDSPPENKSASKSNGA